MQDRLKDLIQLYKIILIFLFFQIIFFIVIQFNFKIW